MTLFTDNIKFDLFVIYIICSVMFVGVCCVLISCLFILRPAGGHSDHQRPKEHTQANKDTITVSLRVQLDSSMPSNKQLNMSKYIKTTRSKSVNVFNTPNGPHFEVAGKEHITSFLTSVEPTAL